MLMGIMRRSITNRTPIAMRNTASCAQKTASGMPVSFRATIVSGKPRRSVPPVTI